MAGEYLMITGEGDVYSEEEARGWLQKSGWRAVERKPLAGPVSLLVAETAESRHEKAHLERPRFPGRAHGSKSSQEPT
jgi:hypothetical protein